MDCLTQSYNNSRTGWNSQETQLNPSNVPNLHVRFRQGPVDGAVYTQPLYVAGLPVNGQPRNVVFVATENSTVYAFDTDSSSPAIWERNLCPAGEVPISADYAFPQNADVNGYPGPWQDLPPAGVAAPYIPYQLAKGQKYEQNIFPAVGVTSTPVIDRSAQILYVVTASQTAPETRRLVPNDFHYRLHALDLATGSDKAGSPVEISATVSGTGSSQLPPGSIAFQALQHLNRPGLLLSQDNIYIAFSSFGDRAPYHGWVFSYDARTLKQKAVLNVTPDIVPGQAGADNDPGSGGGIWQSGCGLAADENGFVYFAVGNGPCNGTRSFGDSVMRTDANLRPVNVFAAPNQAFLNTYDIDLGSGDVMLLPSQPDGVFPDLAVCCGKFPIVYVLHRDSLQYVDAVQAGSLVPVINDRGAFGGAAYFADTRNRYIYYCFNDDSLKAFQISHGMLRLGSLGSRGYNQTTDRFPMGGTPVVSSNGVQAESAVVWVVHRGANLSVVAYDATDLTRRLVNLPVGSWANPQGAAFIQPTVADGKVFVATHEGLSVLTI